MHAGDLNMEKISIIIPCYNVENYIGRCLDSLLAQTIGREHIELICVNDASADDTLSILLHYEKLYPDVIIVIRFDENRGQGAARNAALSYASGAYIGYVDADDFVKPDMLEKLYDALVDYDCDFVECRWETIDDAGMRQGWGKVGKPGLMDLNIYENRVEYIKVSLGMTAVWNKLYKKSFIIDNEIFFPEGLRYEDFFFCFLVYLYAGKYFRVDEALYYYYVNNTGTVRNRKAEYQFDKIDVMLFFWDVCKERELDKKFPDEVEWFFIEKFYVYMLWEVFTYFPERSWVYYKELKAVLTELVPNYKENKYIDWEQSNFDCIMLRLAAADLDESALMQMRKEIVSIW